MNLTGQVVRVGSTIIGPHPKPPRLLQRERTVLRGVNVVKLDMSEFPDPKVGTFFIVDKLTALVCMRPDFMFLKENNNVVQGFNIMDLDALPFQ